MKFVDVHCRVPEGPLVGQKVNLAPVLFYAIYDSKVSIKTAILSQARKKERHHRFYRTGAQRGAGGKSQ